MTQQEIKTGSSALSVGLYTNDPRTPDLCPGEFVATAKLLPYVTMPEAVLWGGRLFMRHRESEAVYVEVFWAVPMQVTLDEPKKPKQGKPDKGEEML